MPVLEVIRSCSRLSIFRARLFAPCRMWMFCFVSDNIVNLEDWLEWERRWVERIEDWRAYRFVVLRKVIKTRYNCGANRNFKLDWKWNVSFCFFIWQKDDIEVFIKVFVIFEIKHAFFKFSIINFKPQTTAATTASASMSINFCLSLTQIDTPPCVKSIGQKA